MPIYMVTIANNGAVEVRTYPDEDEFRDAVESPELLDEMCKGYHDEDYVYDLDDYGMAIMRIRDLKDCYVFEGRKGASETIELLEDKRYTDSERMLAAAKLREAAGLGKQWRARYTDEDGSQMPPEWAEDSSSEWFDTREEAVAWAVDQSEATNPDDGYQTSNRNQWIAGSDDEGCHGWEIVEYDPVDEELAEEEA